MAAPTSTAQRIRVDDLQVQTTAPVPAPADVRRGLRIVAPALVGRGAEMDLLVSVASSPPALVVVEGEAGIGKTRLVAELAKHPTVARYRVLTAACHRIREPFPLGPVLEAVRELRTDLEGATLSPVTGQLRSLLPEIADVLPPAPAPLDDRAAERHRVFRGLVEVLASLGPTVLVLEDLHWADEQTPEFVNYLAANLPPHLSLVLTYRGNEVDPALRAGIAKLPSGVARAEVVLAPLDARQTGTLAAEILDTERVSEEFAACLCESTAGLPFAIEEVLALLRERRDLVRRDGGWERRALDELDVPTTIRDSVLERVSRLSADARAVVEAAAALQVPGAISLLSSVARLNESWLPAVEEALDVGVLMDRNGSVWFRHALAAQAVYDSIPGPRRQDLHARAAAALQATQPAPLAQVAHHLQQAGLVEEWVIAAERAADQCVALGEEGQAVRLLEQVLRGAPMDAAQRGRLAVKLGRAACDAYQSSPDLVSLLLEVHGQDLPGETRAELAFYVATAVQDAGGDAGLVRRLLLEAATRLTGQSEIKVWAMLGLGVHTHPGVPLSEHKQWLTRVIATLPTLDDPVFECYLLGKVAMMLGLFGDASWIDLAARLGALTGGVPTHRREVNAFHSIGGTACSIGHHDDAARFLAIALEGAAACESQQMELEVRSTMTLVDFCRGHWAGLRETADALIHELAGGRWWARADAEVAAACLALAHGDLAQAEESLSGLLPQLEAVDDFSLRPLVVAARARLALAESRPDDVAAAVDLFVGTLADRSYWAPMVRALPPVVEILTATDRDAQADELVRRCSDELRGLDAPLAEPSLAHARGLLLDRRGDPAGAAGQYAAAARAYESAGCVYEAAQARERAGLALFAAGGTDAEPTLLAALATYQHLGATWDAKRCAYVARARGVRVPRPYRGGRRGYGNTLSPRERDVAELAATGRTNDEIAAELFISANTVRKHLVGAMRKLDVHSRAALARCLLETPADN